jgi:hypothetical protein
MEQADSNLIDDVMLMLPMPDSQGHYEPYTMPEQLADSFDCLAHQHNNQDHQTRRCIADWARDDQLHHLVQPARSAQHIEDAKTRWQKTGEAGRDYGVAVAGHTGGAVEEISDDIVKQMYRVEQTAKNFSQAAYGTRTAARAEFYVQHTELKNIVAKNLSRLHMKDIVGVSRGTIFSSRQRFLKAIDFGEMTVDRMIDSEGFRAITNLAKKGRLLKYGGMALGFGFVGLDTLLVYKEGGNWVKELFEDGTALTIGLVVGDLMLGALLMFTPVGWAILITAAAEVAIAGIIKYGISEHDEFLVGK